MKKTNKKLIAMLLVMALLVGGAVGGTLAWLLDKTNTITNTFTDSDINITLEEKSTEATSDTEYSYQMIPGHTIDKDPKVTVAADSEDCWLFVKVTESTTPDLDAYIAYAIAEGWDIVGENSDENDEYVISRKVYKEDTVKSFEILAEGSYKYHEGQNDEVSVSWGNNQVGVKPEVTKEMMDAIDGATSSESQPTLSFQAAAVQLFEKNSNGIKDQTDDEFTEAEALAKVVWPD